MGVPTSEVGYTPAMPRREDHEVHKRTCGGIGGRNKKKTSIRTSWTFVTPVTMQFNVVAERCKALYRKETSTTALVFEVKST